MEDRQPLGLWLELLREDDVGARAATLAAAGLRVSTWSADDYPQRLPKTLDDCHALIVGEGDPAAYDELPASDDSTTVVPLQRYPRPSQGICTGEPTNGLLLVLITPRQQAQAQALRDWADFVHLRHITQAAVPGYTMVTPYENATADGPRFLHLYEMDTPDAEEAFRSMTPLVTKRLDGGPGTEPFDSWARHPQLRIDYVNTFRLVGTRSRP